MKVAEKGRFDMMHEQSTLRTPPRVINVNARLAASVDFPAATCDQNHCAEG